MRPLPLLALALTAITSSLHASEVDPSLKYFRDLAETRDYSLGRPVSPKVTPDGRSVIFLRSEPRDPTLKLYEFDIAARKERELLTPAQLLGSAEEKLSAEEKARRERARESMRGFTSFQLSNDGARLLVTLSGKLYVVERPSLAVSELPGSGWIDPRFSPDGNFVAAAANRELHVIDLSRDTPTVRTLTSGATETISHGIAEFVAQEEMQRLEGYWWSPDSQWLVFQTTDEAGVEVRYVADPLHPAVAPTRFFYPRAGTPNAKVSLSLVARDGGNARSIAWDSANFPYLARVRWEKNAPLSLLVQNREQTEQAVLTVEPSSLQTRELLREKDAAWLNLDDGEFPHWLGDGKHFLWTTESRGAWQVELRAADGKLIREITPLSWGYRGLVGVDEPSGTIFVLGGHDAREVQLWKFPLSGDSGTALTAERGRHAAEYFKEPRLLVHMADLADGRVAAEVTNVDAQQLAALPSIAETPAQIPGTEITRTVGDRVFDAALTRPRNFEPHKRYPVILKVYAGPTSKTVNATARDYFTDQWVADQGYVVVRIDGRGTPWHGRDWERVIKSNFIDIALEDQIAGLRALASKHPELDLTRVGVTGWSFGGYFAAMATIRRPDVFLCGVAGAPVITWQNYDTHYTERYLGLPQNAPEAYRVSNVTTYASQLSRPLLLIHGLTDDNVYFQHTLQLADALYLAGKPYELMPMLGTHMVSDPVVRLRLQQRIIEFFDRELKH
jgi:dipeptidyl-peptidase-4